MRNITAILFIVIIGLSCCPRNVPNEKIVIDSLKALIQFDSLTIASLSSKLRQQRILIQFTAAKCHKYAVIVQKNPGQSVFIVNWIDRSFQWMNDSSAH